MHLQALSFDRRKQVLAGIVSALALTPLPAAAQQQQQSQPQLQQQQQQQPPTDFRSIVQQMKPAVVAITTRQRVEQQQQQQQETQTLPEDMPFREFFRRYFDERQSPRQRQSRRALGSGFVISADGHIITNSHVVADADEIQVVFGEDSPVPAKLVGRDPATDIAVLKVDPQPNMKVATWGDSDAAEPGSWAIAIGSPFGLGGTVTVGVVSARSRDIRSGPYDDYIQTDASINRGNSGGPLFNANGEVIGVNTAIFSPSGVNIGIGFAVPSRTAQMVAEQLIRTGRVERGYVGLRLQEITPAIAQALGRQDDSGVLVASVEPGGPAEKAGIRTGDVITQFNGQPIESGRDLSRAVAATKPGAQAQITLFRNNNTQEVTVTVGQRDAEQSTPAASAEGAESSKRLGVALAPVPEAARNRLGLEPDISGVLIQRVEPDSPAAETGLRQGDIIVSAGNQSVSQPSDVANAWAQAQRQNKPLLLRVYRDGQSLFVAVEASS